MKNIKILHIIGKVGAGKTTFIKKYFPNEYIFDIREIYEEYGFNPSEIKDAESYSQFYSAIIYRIESLIKELEQNNINLLIVESSGLNKAINKAIEKYDRLIILIKSSFSDKIESVNSYAYELNEKIDEAIRNDKLKYNLIFDFDNKEILGNIPENFNNIIFNLKTKLKSVNP